MRKILALSWTLALISVLTVWGMSISPDENKAGQKTQTISGRVAKIDATSLTVEKRDTAGTPETVTVTLNNDTQKPSDLSVGTEITVEYKVVDGQKIATKITSKTIGTPP